MNRPVYLSNKEVKLLLIALGYYIYLFRDIHGDSIEIEEMCEIQSRLIDHYEK